ncbi:hypothetical protein CMI47_08435 [Candidatus Pacearchaeota archaeon]|nr:hypothetical protein [Candidatus Pacearchaeota archaeon]
MLSQIDLRCEGEAVKKRGRRATMTVSQAGDAFRELAESCGFTARWSSPIELKKVYRKLAWCLHPDRRPGEKALATEEMKTLNAAIQVLGRRNRAASVQSIGFPKGWPDRRIQAWLQEHHFVPLKEPHRTEGKFAWTRLEQPDYDKFRYRTGAWGKGIKVRYAIPKGYQGGRNVKHNAQVFLEFLSASQKRKLDRIFPADAEWAVEPTSEDFPELPLWLTRDSSFWQAVMAERTKRGKGGRRNLELLTVKPGKILPVSNPAFNIREAAKQMILLEDHLSVPEKRCPDCIGKHLLAIEALADEAASLDKEKRLGKLPGKLALMSRKAQKELLSGADPCKVAQDIRAQRKKLLPLVFPYSRPRA